MVETRVIHHCLRERSRILAGPLPRGTGPREPRTRRRGGVTLIEGLFFASLAMVLIVLVIAFYTQSWRLFDTRTRTGALVTDARKLFENLVSGLRSACLVTRPLSAGDWQRDATLVFYRHASGDARRRLVANLGGSAGREYPFSSDSQDETVQLLDCVEETYRRSGGSVERSQVGGYLRRTSVRGGDTTFAFEADAKVLPASKETMADHVTRLEIVPIGLFAPPAPGQRILSAERPGGASLAPDDIALVAIRFKAEDRPADRPNVADAGVLELATKVWLDEKSMALRFPGAFSSVDGELEY